MAASRIALESRGYGPRMLLLHHAAMLFVPAFAGRYAYPQARNTSQTAAPMSRLKKKKHPRKAARRNEPRDTEPRLTQAHAADGRAFIEPAEAHMAAEPESAKAQEATNAATERIERMQLWFNGILAACGIAGVLFAIYQGMAVERQIRIARNAVEQTDKSLELARRDQRAWVSVKSIVIEKPTAGTTVKPTITIANSGRTPALIYRGQVYVLAVAGDLPTEEARHRLRLTIDERLGKAPIDDNLKVVIAPNQEAQLGPPNSPVEIDERSMRLLESGDLIYVVRVGLWYTGPKDTAGETTQDFIYHFKSGKCIPRGTSDEMQ